VSSSKGKCIRLASHKKDKCFNDTDLTREKDLKRLKTKRTEYEDMLFPLTGLEGISEMH
jgi:hypothetical protein